MNAGMMTNTRNIDGLTADDNGDRGAAPLTNRAGAITTRRSGHWGGLTVALAGLAALSSCSGSTTMAETSVEAAATTAATVPVAPPSPPSSLPSTTTPTPPTTTATTTAATTAPPTTPATPPGTAANDTSAPPTTSGEETPVPSVPDRSVRFDFTQDRFEIGTSVEGRPIVAERYGTPGGRRMLVLGVIHGDEDAGVQIVEKLRAEKIPEGVELWIVESMNPDGQAAQIRHNANGVDLNRNFPYGWEAMAPVGSWQYPGTGPASEPETRAMVNFVAQLKPDMAISYHQDLFVISEGKGRAEHIRARYAELSGIPLEPTFSTPGAKYTGIAMTWINHDLGARDAVAFVVELGPTLSDEDAGRNANAVLTVAAEG